MMSSSVSTGICQRQLRILTVVFAALLVPVSVVQSSEIEGVRFPEQLQVGEAQLKLRGAGLLRYRVFIKAYVAALYLDERTSSADVLGDYPRRLEIEYFWSIPAHRFEKATVDGITRNVDAQSLEALRERIVKFNTFYEDIAPGDRYAVTYLPGRGTELAKNGEPIGSVAGSDFASALFAIWLGPNALNDNLRRDLLANR
jgi:hypothetical protein